MHFRKREIPNLLSLSRILCAFVFVATFERAKNPGFSLARAGVRDRFRGRKACAPMELCNYHRLFLGRARRQSSLYLSVTRDRKRRPKAATADLGPHCA